MGQRHRLHTVFTGKVFVLGEGHRVDHTQGQHAIAGDFHLPQQLLHARAIGAQLRHVGGRFFGVEEQDFHRLLQPADDIARAVGQRVEVVLREVDAQTRKQTDHGHTDQQEYAGDGKTSA